MKKTYISIFLLILTLNVYAQWEPISSSTHTSFYAVKFFNRNTGIIAGQDTVGKIFRTTDGGSSWNMVHRTTGSEMFECLFFINDQTGWSGTYSSYLYKTTNGGLNWYIPGNRLSGVGRITALFFADPMKGWMIGDNGKARTTNGGVSWIESFGGGGAVHFFDINTGIISDINNTITRTTNGGVTYSSVYTMPSYHGVFDFHFLNSQTGFAAGTKKMFLKTTNAGVNWSLINIDTAQGSDIFRAIHFLDVNLGYAAGQYIFSNIGGTTTYGVLRKTTNGGLNWTNISVSPIPDSYEDIDITEGQFGYVVGHTNHMYKSSTAGFVGISNINSEIPSQFSLSQNYPNPFNPNTKIRFDIKYKSNAWLIVYNTLGHEIRTLVDKELNAGTYEADFTADDLPSGVYFYRLASGEFIQTKKMILLK